MAREKAIAKPRRGRVRPLMFGLWDDNLDPADDPPLDPPLPPGAPGIVVIVADTDGPPPTYEGDDGPDEED